MAVEAEERRIREEERQLEFLYPAANGGVSLSISPSISVCLSPSLLQTALKLIGVVW